MNKNPVSSYTIRFGDCDLFGHLNNARYLDYFLNAREDHLKETYEISLKDFFQQGVSWLVGSHHISYLRPALYDETVLIRSSLLKVAEDFLLVEMMMMDERQTHLKCFLWTTFIPINVKTGRRQNHPAAFMDFAKSIEADEVAGSNNFQERLKEILASVNK